MYVKANSLPPKGVNLTLLARTCGDMYSLPVCTSKLLLSAISRELEHCWVLPCCKCICAMRRWLSIELLSCSMQRCTNVAEASTLPVSVVGDIERVSLCIHYMYVHTYMYVYVSAVAKVEPPKGIFL